MHRLFCIVIRINADVCMVERGADFLPGKALQLFARGWPGALATTVREPWARFRSNFERDYSMNTGKPPKHPVLSIEQFAVMGDGDNMWRIGHYNWPNFYTRCLAGIDATRDRGNVTLGDLDLATETLRAFTHVFVLEEIDSQERLLASLMGKRTASAFAHRSNNAFSNSSGAHNNKEIKVAPPVPPPSEHYAKTFYDQNDLDVAFYQYARALAHDRQRAQGYTSTYATQQKLEDRGRARK
jgi:hypothetical protein